LTDYTETTHFLRNENIVIRANITDSEDNINTVKINVTNPNGPEGSPILNADMTCVESITNGCIYEYNLSSIYTTVSGTWNITITATDSNSFANTTIAHFSVSKNPELRYGTEDPASTGWGETFSFQIQIRDADSDTVGLMLWESSDNATWELVIKQNYTTSGVFAEKDYTINSTNCTATSTGSSGAITCNPHNKSMVGTRYWKFNVTDYKRGTAETSSDFYNVEKDNVSISYSAGDGININRSGGSDLLKLRIQDTDRGVYVESGISGRFFDDVAVNDTTTDSDGYLSYTVSPNCSYSAGSHNWQGGTYNDPAYEDKNSTAYSFTVIGWVLDSLEQPLAQNFNVSEQILIRLNITDECSNLVSGAGITIEALDADNNSFECSEVNDEGTGWYNCTWNSTGRNEGNYSIRINSSKTNYNSNSTYYNNVFFLNNQNPNATDLLDTPEIGGWGETFTYNASVTDPENDNVTCTLWVNTTGSWVNKGSTTQQTPYTCSLQVSDYTSAEIGLYYYKFQLNDTYNEINTSDQLGIITNGTIEEDDTAIEYLTGNNSEVSRESDGNITIGARLKDTDNNQYISDENLKFWVYYNTQWNDVNTTLTNADGNATFDWNPDCEAEPGVHNWKGNYSGSSEYKQSESDNFTTTVYGTLGINLDYPINQVFHKNDTFDLNSTVNYDCSDSGADVNWYVDADNIASGEKTNWTIPTDYSLGSFTLNATTNKTYYYTADNTTGIEIWGYSQVNINYPVDGASYGRGSLNILCQVNDSFGGGINNYPVEFKIDSASVYNGTTNSTGTANYTWNTLAYSTGNHQIDCIITDNSSLYYNASITQSTVNVTLIGTLNANISLTPSPPGPVARNTGGTSSTTISWNITDIRDENNDPVTGTNITVYWKNIYIGNTTNGTYDILDNNALGENNDTINITITKQNYEDFNNVSDDYEVHGIISQLNSTVSWTPSGDYIDNYESGPEGGPIIQTIYTIRDKQNNILAETTDYTNSTGGDYNASDNNAATQMTANITFSGTGNYEGTFTEDKTYWVYGYISSISEITWEPSGTGIDRTYPTTAGFGSGAGGQNPWVEYNIGSITVLDNLGTPIPASNYTEPHEDDSLKEGDWNPQDNEAGDLITAIARVNSTLDGGVGGYWHGTATTQKTFTVWGKSTIEYDSPANETDVYRTTCNTPDNLTLRIHIKDEFGHLGSGATVIFYTPNGTCNPVDENNGYYNCTFNPQDGIVPKNYIWDAEALEEAPWHGSGNASEGGAYSTIDIFGCFNIDIIEPAELEEFNRSDIVLIKANLTDELNQTINESTVTSDITKSNTTHIYPSMSYNQSSKLWEGNYTIASSDPIGLWQLSVDAAKSYYDSSSDQSNFTVLGALNVTSILAQDKVDRGGSWGFGETALLNATVVDENGTIENATVKFYANQGYIGEDTTDSNGIAAINWNPDNALQAGTYIITAIASKQYYNNYTGNRNDTIDVYGLLNITQTSSQEKVDRKTDYGYGITALINATIKDELGTPINNSHTEFYAAGIGQLGTNSSGSNGFYTINWNPADSTVPEEYVIYANAKNVQYYHNYTSTHPNSTTDVYGKLFVNLNLNETQIYRHDNFSPFVVLMESNITDENNVTVSSAATNFTVNNSLVNSTQTDGNGIANYAYNPENTKLLENYTINSTAEKDYYWGNHDITYLVIKGVLYPNITLPVNSTKFYRGDQINLNSTTMDENNNQTLLETFSWTLIETGENLGNAENSIWGMPSNHSIGIFTINLTTTKTFYDTGINTTKIKIFGRNNISIITESQTISRGNNIVYFANVSDVNGTVLSNYTCLWWIDNSNTQNTTTNSTGICSYSFTPSCSYNVGIHQINATIQSRNESYYDPLKSNDNSTATINDSLSITINLPEENQIIHRTENITLNSTASDYCGAPPTDSYSVKWYNETSEIEEGEDIYWVVPLNYSLGLRNITANATGNYYTKTGNLTSVYVYGWSSVSDISPDSGTYLRGQQITFNCTIMDANTSEPINNYPVSFYQNGTSVLNATTNSEGIANWTWNTTPETPGFYEIKCNITHNSTLYYNASVAESSATIEIESRLNVDEIAVDNTTIYRKDLYSPYQSNITVKVTESALGPIENATVHVYTPDGELNCNTSSTGYCSVLWNPTETLTPDNYIIDINSTKTGYTDSNTENTSIIVRGKLDLTISSPSEDGYHKGETINLGWAAYDENGAQTGANPTVTWNNSYNETILQQNLWSNIQPWQIPLNYSLGPDVLNATAEKQWFDSSSDSVNITIWGYSNITYIEPEEGNYSYGEQIQVKCFVKDVNLSEGIENYTADFYHNSTSIGANQTNSTGHSTILWNPPNLGTYILKCMINNSADLHYNTTINEGNKIIIIVDSEKPNIRNTTINPILLETHQIIILWANTTDDINASKVWAFIEKPDGNKTNITLTKIPGSEYQIIGAYPVLYGALYNKSYSPDVGGIYNITFYVNDTSNNINQTVRYQFEAIPKTTAVNELSPNAVNLFNITWAEPQSFDMNATCANTGNATAYSMNLTLSVPGGWMANITFPQNCGNINNGSECIRLFNITVPAATLGTFTINSTCAWRNPDLTLENNTDISTVVIAESNQILNIIEDSISTTVEHNQTNSTTFNVSSIGNDGLENITVVCNSGDVCVNFTVAFSNNYFNLNAGDSIEIMTNVSAPVGFDPGTYYGEIKANATNTTCVYEGNCWDNASLEVVVLTSKTWNRTQETLPLKTVHDNTTGFYGNITINNTGNVPLNFTISTNGNISSIFVYQNITIQKQTAKNLTINYTVPVTLNPGIYSGQIIINAEDNSIPVQLNTSVSLEVKDNINPVVNWFNITTPSTLDIIDLNREQARFEANVTDNIEIDRVWIMGSAFGGGTVMYDDGTKGDLIAGNNIYTILHNFTNNGNQSVQIYTKDTSGNDKLSGTKTLEVIATTSGILRPNATYLEIEDVTYQDNSTFTLSIVFNNTGQGGAYKTNISLELPANFTANSTFEECGKIEEQNVTGDYCIKTFNITVLAKTPQGEYYINQTVEWENPDRSIDTATNQTLIKITNKEWDRSPSLISEIVYTNTSGEFIVAISNTGEIPLNFTIENSGNATSLISLPSYIYVENSTQDNFTINYSIPLTHQLGIYEQIINISNDTAYPLNRITTLILNLSDNVLPVIKNLNISKTSLEANYENLTIEANATDNINISKVWAHIVAPEYTQDVELNLISENHYSVVYTPTKGGFHNVTVYANDTSNNINNESAGVFNVTGNASGTNKQFPPTQIFTTNSTTGAVFNVTVEVNNTGPGTMRFVNIAIIPEHAGDWSEISGNYTKSCGNLSAGENCAKEFQIEIPVCSSQGSKDVISNFTWQNPDLSINSVENRTEIQVNSKPVLEIPETEIINNIEHNEQKQAGSFTIISSGNTVLSGINYFADGGNLSGSWVSFDPNPVAVLGGCGDNYSVDVSVTVPQYQDPGLYWTKINATTNANDEWLWLNITVNEDGSWNRNPASQYRLAAVGTSGNFTIDVTNSGNLEINFSILASGNATSMFISIPSNIAVQKGSTEQIMMDYIVPSSQADGIYTVDIEIKNSSASPSTTHSYITMNVTDIPPEITDLSISPSTMDVNYESAAINATVIDNGVIDSVWANITTPNGSIEIVDMNHAVGDLWTVSYVPNQTGEYVIVIQAKDTKDLTSSSSSFSLTAIGTTNLNAITNLSHVFDNITQINGASLELNITLKNTGQGGAYFSNLSFDLPTNWTYNQSLLDYRNITEGANKTRSVVINVSSGASPGIYAVNLIANWMNPDNSIGQNLTQVSVEIKANPVLEIINSSLSATIQHNQSSQINFLLNSTGNADVENINFSCLGTQCSEFNITFNPSQVTSLPPFSTQNISLNSNIPFGYAPNQYNLTINASADQTYNSAPLEITIPANKSWTRSPGNFPLLKIGTGSKGYLGIINITSLANIQIGFNISITGNLSDYLSANASQLLVNKTDKKGIKINYTIPSVGGYYTAVISIKNSSANPKEQNISIEIEALEFKTRILFVNPNIDIESGDIISIMTNVSYEEQPVEENISFEVKFGDNICQENSTTFSFLTETWTVDCIAPVIIDGRSYDVIAQAYYSTEDAIAIDILAEGIYYKDVSPPEFINISSPSVLIGSNATISVLIEDNTETSKVAINITYPNGSSVAGDMENQTDNISYTYWNYNMENITQIGDYDVIITASDSLNNSAKDTAWFEAYPNLVKLSGKIGDANNNSVSTKFELYRVNKSTERYLIDSFETNETGNYSELVRNRTYNIKFRTLSQVIELWQVPINRNISDPIKFDEIEKKYISIPLTRRILRGIGVKNNFNLSKVVLTLNFTGTEYESNFIDAITIYKCSDWDFYSRKCNSSWSKIGGAVNVDYETISVNSSSFSAYAIAEEVVCGNGICESDYGENSDNCVADCPVPPITQPTTNSGGGGTTNVEGLTKEELREELEKLKEEKLPPFAIETDLIEATLHPGESKMYSMWVTNNLDEEINATLKIIGNVWEFIQLETSEIKIGPKNLGTVKIKVFTLATTQPGIYTGDLIITVGETQRSIPITIAVTPEKEALLDVKVEVITKQLVLNDTLKFHISLYNLGFKKRFDVHLIYRIKDMRTEKIIGYKEEEVALETSLSAVKMFDLGELETPELGKYFLEVEARYDNRTASSVDMFEIVMPFWTKERINMLIAIIVIIGLIAGSYFGTKYYKKQKLAKLRYISPVDYKTLPTGKIWLGEIAETNRRAEFSVDDLSTHILVAGATGSGKTVSAMVVAEELLKQNVSVVVFDPTGQWTGFVKPCRDKNLLSRYKEFGLKEEEARPFKGLIYEITDPNFKIDFEKYMKPGEITVFTLTKLTTKQFDTAVRNIINMIFKQGFEESPNLRMCIVFDEVHRLLEKYGGKGAYTSLERGAREFRKWGIGMMMASQVLADFKEAVKGNVLTEFQLHTKGLGDVERVEKKFGKIYAERVTREEVGVGMVQNPKYNKGRPWFVRFRPLLHSPHKILDKDLELYKIYTIKLKNIEKIIEKIKKKGIDTSDIELELRLAEDKLKTGAFKMAEIYLGSLDIKIREYEK